MIEWMMEHPRCALWAGMGIGKTTAVLWARELMQLYGRMLNGPTLIVAPARVAKDTWTDEVARWSQFDHLEIIPIVGTPRQRAKAIKLDRAVFTVSFENAPWLVEQWLARWPYRQVVIDECDRVKGFRISQGGMRAHALGRIAHHCVDRWLNMGGTPVPNGLKDLWGQTWYLDRGARLGATYTAFLQRWFRKNWNGYGVQPLPGAAEQIYALLEDICLTVDPKDYYSLKDPIYKKIEIHLPKKAAKVYKDLETQMFHQFEDTERITTMNAAALTNKCMQLANGAVYTEYPKWRPVHDEKLDALKSIKAQSGGAPLFVSYAFKSDKARLLKTFKDAVDLATPAGLGAFKSGRAPMGIAHPGSMGHGIDGLQHHCHHLVRFGRDWNLGWQLQMLERIGPMRQMQGGYKRNVYVYDIVAKGTVDEDCVDAHVTKRSVQDALLLATNRYRKARSAARKLKRAA